MRPELMFVLLGALFVAAPAGAGTIERVGYAYAAGEGSDELLYTEQHREQVEHGRITRSTVTYEDVDGNIIARKNLEFGSHPVSPEFKLEGISNGHIEGAKREEGEFIVYFRRSDEHDYVEESISLPESAIIDGGFDRFIENNWQALLDGRVFERPFLVPSFQKFVDFKIYLDSLTETEAVFVMETASFLLRILSEKIIVTYDRESIALKRYQGISNIRDRSGENYDVRVEFPAAGGGAGTVAHE